MTSSEASIDGSNVTLSPILSFISDEQQTSLRSVDITSENMYRIMAELTSLPESRSTSEATESDANSADDLQAGGVAAVEGSQPMPVQGMVAVPTSGPANAAASSSNNPSQDSFPLRPQHPKPLLEVFCMKMGRLCSYIC